MDNFFSAAGNMLGHEHKRVQRMVNGRMVDVPAVQFNYEHGTALYDGMSWTFSTAAA